MIDEIREIEDSIGDELEEDCVTALEILYDLRFGDNSDTLQHVYGCMIKLMCRVYPDNWVLPTEQQIAEDWNR